MTDTPDADKHNRTTGGPGVVGVLMPIVLTAGLASVMFILYFARVHPVRYFLDVTAAREQSFWAYAYAVTAAAVGLAVSQLAAISYWRRHGVRFCSADRGALWRALWPTGAAACWLVLLIDDPRINLLIVFSSIALVGWSAARFVAGVARLVPARSSDRCDAWWCEPGFLGLSVLVVLLTIFHTHVQIGMYNSLQYGSPDIGYHAEMLHNAVRGQGLYCEAFGHHYFGEHFSPALYLLTPLWAVLPHIELLMVVGALVVLSGCLPVYAMTRSLGGSRVAASALGMAYLLYPSTSRIIYGGSYGFHEVLIAIPLMLWSFHHFACRQWWRMAVFIVLALSVKENVAIVYSAFGVYVFASDRRQRWGLVLGGLCAAYFVVCLAWIVPSFSSSGSYSKTYLYGQFGETPGDVLLTMLRNPSLVADRLGSWRPLCYVLSLTIPLFLLPFRRVVLLVAAPTLIFTMLMNTPSFMSIRFWHQASILPVLWLATAQAVATAGRKRSAWAAVLVCSMATHYAMGVSPVSRVWRKLPQMLQRSDRSEVIEQLDAMIDPGDTVQATARLAAHFYNRERVYPMHATPADLPDWILVDVDDAFTGSESRASAVEYLSLISTSERYGVALQREGITVFRIRNQADRSPAGRR